MAGFSGILNPLRAPSDWVNLDGKKFLEGMTKEETDKIDEEFDNEIKKLL